MEGVAGIGVDTIGASARLLNRPVTRVMDPKGIISCITRQPISLTACVVEDTIRLANALPVRAIPPLPAATIKTSTDWPAPSA